VCVCNASWVSRVERYEQERVRADKLNYRFPSESQLAVANSLVEKQRGHWWKTNRWMSCERNVTVVINNRCVITDADTNVARYRKQYPRLRDAKELQSGPSSASHFWRMSSQTRLGMHFDGLVYA